MELQLTPINGVHSINLLPGLLPKQQQQQRQNALSSLPATTHHHSRLKANTKRRFCRPQATASPTQAPATGRLPPGPWQLPLIGSMHHLLSAFPNRALRDLAQVHGPLMLLRLGEIDLVVVSSREGAEEIMRTQDLNFVYRPTLVAVDIVCYGSKDIAFSSYSDYWKQLRRIAVMELLSGKRVRSFSSLRIEEVGNLVRDVAAGAARCQPVNLSGKLISLTNTIICRASFGQKCSDQQGFIAAVEEAMTLASGFSAADLFRSLKFIDVLTGMRSRLERIHRKIDDILDATIQAHQLNRNEGEEHDLINILLHLKDHGELELPITFDNIKAVIVDMFVGGTETSSSIIDWAMSELMRHPEVMAKAQEEVREAMKGKTIVGESDVGELNYLKSVVKETLRLHPPIPLLVPRVCKETCQVLGYTIPAGTRIIVNAWALGRDPRYWEDAESFKPERFENNPIDYRGHGFEFIPFGAGRRICPGLSFGTAAVELALAQLLFYFDWKLPNGMQPQDVDMTETFGVSAVRTTELCLHATPRYPLPHV